MAKAMIDVVYWDANAFLALINEDRSPSKMQGCNDLWVLGEKGLIKIVTSTLTVAEVIYMKGMPKLDPAKRPLVNNFFRRPFIVQRPVTREIAELARDVVWDYGIKPKDAVHAATVSFFDIKELHTFDDGLLNKNPLNIDSKQIIVCKPHGPNQMGLLGPKP